MKHQTDDVHVEKRTVEVIGRQAFHRTGIGQLICQRIVKVFCATENGIDRNVLGPGSPLGKYCSEINGRKMKHSNASQNSGVEKDTFCM